MDNDSKPANDNVDEDENTSGEIHYGKPFSMAFPTPLVTENHTMDSGPSVSLPIQGLKRAQGHPNGLSAKQSHEEMDTCLWTQAACFTYSCISNIYNSFYHTLIMAQPLMSSENPQTWHSQ
jgi:hypothetical protein